MTEDASTGAPRIVAVSLSAGHAFSKANQASVRLLEGLGVEGDVHCGPTMRDGGKDVPNTRQVHLMHAELFGEMAQKGYGLVAGAIGENITTTGIDLLSLPTGARLYLGEAAVIELTGLRAPCSQVEKYAKGLLYELAHKEDGEVRIKSGVMSVVVRGGDVRPGDPIRVELPDGEAAPLKPV